MRPVKKGEPWSRKYLDEQLKWWQVDWNKHRPVDAYWWAVRTADADALKEVPADVPRARNGCVFVGVASLHTFRSCPVASLRKEFFVTRFLARWAQRRGIGTTMLHLALGQLWQLRRDVRRVLSLSLLSNVAAHRSLAKVGFRRCEQTVTIREKEYAMFEFPRPTD